MVKPVNKTIKLLKFQLPVLAYINCEFRQMSSQLGRYRMPESTILLIFANTWCEDGRIVTATAFLACTQDRINFFQILIIICLALANESQRHIQASPLPPKLHFFCGQVPLLIARPVLTSPEDSRLRPMMSWFQVLYPRFFPLISPSPAIWLVFNIIHPWKITFPWNIDLGVVKVNLDLSFK